MINFGKIFNDESAAIGLSGLGLARKIENKNTSTPKKHVISPEAKRMQQNMTAFSSTNSLKSTPNTLHLDFSQKQNRDAIDNLFGRTPKLNFNSGKFTG